MEQAKKQYSTTLTNKQVEQLHKAYAKDTGKALFSVQTGVALRYAAEKLINKEK